MHPIHSDYAPMMSRGRGRTNLANPTLTAPVSTILPQSLMPKVVTFTGNPTPALWKPLIEPPRELRQPFISSLIQGDSLLVPGYRGTPASLSQPSSPRSSPSPPEILPSWSTVTEDLLVFPTLQDLGRQTSNSYWGYSDSAYTLGIEHPTLMATGNDGKEPIDEALRIYQHLESLNQMTTEPTRIPNEIDTTVLTANSALSAANQLAAMQLSHDSETSAASVSPRQPESPRTNEYSQPAPFTPHRGYETPTSAAKNPYKWTRADAKTSPSDTAKLTPPSTVPAAELSPRSKLSVEAKEFVPRKKSFAEPEEAYRPIYKVSDRSLPSVPESNADRAVRVLCSSMHVMSLEPASFHREAPSLVEAFGVWLSDAGATHAVVSALMERALIDANFRFNGARLCAALHAEYGSRFSNVLLAKCREEHERISETLISAPSRVQGFAAFAADLFVTLETAVGSRRRIASLGTAVMDTVVAMLREPTHEHVKCICHTLKLAGYHLEACDKPTLDAIISRLQALCADENSPAISQLLVASLVKLRSENWGIGHTEAAAVEVPPAAAGLNEPTFYGPDGAILTEEESAFLQDQFSDEGEADFAGPDEIWVEDEEMDEEIQAAFEQFLLLSKQK